MFGQIELFKVNIRRFYNFNLVVERNDEEVQNSCFVCVIMCVILCVLMVIINIYVLVSKSMVIV